MPKSLSEKPIIVLLPGYDGDGTGSFGKLRQYLRSIFKVISLDYPYTASPEKAYTLDELVDYVHSKVSKLGKVQLMGFSMGGFVACRYAQLYPDQVGLLTLISSSPVLADTYIISLAAKIAVPAVRNRSLANAFCAIYCSPHFKWLLTSSPLPVPRVNIPSRMGYSYFGTLGNVIRGIKSPEYVKALSKIIVAKKALLFRDDMSFPAEVYEPLLKSVGFKVTVRDVGGHATGVNYWKQVANFYQQKTSV